jgi:subfamily B ATP-binding cassette protein MsbA
LLKETSFYKVFALLAKDLRARLPALALVALLASVAAFSEKAPLLLIQPLLDRVLFPRNVAQQVADGEGEVANAPEQVDVPPDGAGVLPARHGLQVWIEDWFFGPPGSIASVDERSAMLWKVVLAVAVMTALAAAATYVFTLVSRWVALRMVIDLRQRLARHLLGLSMRYHGERRFGDLLSRVSSDVGTTLSVVNIIFKELTREPLLMLGSLGVAFAAAPLPTLGVVLLLPVVILPISMLGKRVKKRSRKSLTRLGASVEVLAQMFQGIRTVKAFRAEQRELARYRDVNEHYLKDSLKMVRAVATIQASTTLISQLGFAAVLLVVGLLSIHYALFTSTGQMSTFIVGVATVYTHVKRISSAANTVQEAAGAAERLQQILDEPEDVIEHAGALPIAGLGRGIAFESVSLTYPGQPEAALRDVSIAIRPGETLALVGASGAGKTTFVDLIARYLVPTAGRITVDGRDLCDVSLDSWTSLFAMVGQVPFLFHTSILENIRYGKPAASLAEVEEAARAANIHDFIAALPQGYDTPVGDMGARLSGGQRQRITIARALLKGAPLLLLDEATSALDSESEAVVQEALDRLMRGRTVIVIAHRLSTIRHADRIAVLSHGRLVELGSHAELLERRGTYARLHEVQFAHAKEVGA